MRLSEINPFVRQSLVGQINQNTEYDLLNRLKTRDCRLFYIVSGYGKMEIENEVYNIQPGSTILFQSGTEYLWDVNEIKYYTVNFDYTHNFEHINQTFHPVHTESFFEDDIFEQINFDDYSELNHPIVLQNASSLENRIQLLTTEYYIGGMCCDLLLSTLLKSLIVSIVKLNNEKKTLHTTKEITLVRNIIEYISTNYSQKITNPDIATKFNFNPSYINRVFKKHAKVSMHDFLLTYRLNMAMELLRTQNTSIQDIAKMTGFEDIPHFTRTFKKRTGKTPKEYRNYHI